MEKKRTKYVKRKEEKARVNKRMRRGRELEWRRWVFIALIKILADNS